MLPAPLAPLGALRQFIVCEFAPLPDGKTRKIPLDYRTGATCNAHDPSAWTSYDEAHAVMTRWGGAPRFGVGFVLTSGDPFFVLDVDGALGPNGWSQTALDLIAALPGCAVEVSHSGKGLHVWGRSSSIPPHGKKNIGLGIELYSELRYVALGSGAVGEMAPECFTLPAVIDRYFKPAPAAVGGHAGDGPRPEWRGPADDGEIIRRALQSNSAAQAFGGNRASFRDLWERNVDALARAYPATNPSSAEPYDASSADAALAQHLAFWTGCDAARIERIMRLSALVRSKYDRGDYLPRTIGGAITRQVDVLQDKPTAVETLGLGVGEVAPPPTSVSRPIESPFPKSTTVMPTAQVIEGSTFLGADAQTKLFAGCVYVVDQHRVLVPGGDLLKPEQFKALFGGFAFAMDSRNEKISRDAWEAFTQSQVLRWPRAKGTTFQPALPYGQIVNRDGRTLVNTWWPIDVPCAPGDVAPFLRHLEILLPNPRDRAIQLAYMAGIVQYPGRKSPWATLLIGVEGNGKTFLSLAVAKAVGEKYVHWPKASKIAGQFNGWIVGKILFCVEDIYTRDGVDVIEELKPLITGTSIEIEKKGVDQFSGENVGNFLFNSNHENALKKTANDRRFAVLFCGQSEALHLIRDGLTEEYMRKLYEWANNGGWAAITHYLRNYKIPPELDFTKGAQRAPETSGNARAIAASLGAAEQEIAEAIEQGEEGMRGGWVSSTAIDRVLQRVGRAGMVPRSRRREMMKTLGYDWHPGLPNGRVNNLVLPDACRPVLFVRHGHETCGWTVAAQIAAAYAAAQGVK